MSARDSENVSRAEVPDTVNSLTMVGEFGFDHYEGPFPFNMEGGKWGVVIPKDRLEDIRETALKGHEDQPALVWADGDPVVGGHLTEVVEDEEHDDYHAVGDGYPMGDE